MKAGVAGRALGLLVLLVLTWQVFRKGFGFQHHGVLALVHNVNFLFHEAGHIIFGFFGELIAALGGSLNQVLMPALCTAEFARRRQVFSAAVTLFWTGQNVVDVAAYVADGRKQAMPLFAEGLIHDWNFLLGRLGLLAWAETLGRLVFLVGALVILAALGLAAWDLHRAWQSVDRSEGAHVE